MLRFHDASALCCNLCCLLLQPEAFEKQGRALPRPVRAWPPRENGRFDTIGQIPPRPWSPQEAAAAAAAEPVEGGGGAEGGLLPAA